MFGKLEHLTAHLAVRESLGLLRRNMFVGDERALLETLRSVGQFNGPGEIERPVDVGPKPEEYHYHLKKIMSALSDNDDYKRNGIDDQDLHLAMRLSYDTKASVDPYKAAALNYFVRCIDALGGKEYLENEKPHNLLRQLRKQEVGNFENVDGYYKHAGGAKFVRDLYEHAKQAGYGATSDIKAEMSHNRGNADADAERKVSAAGQYGLEGMKTQGVVSHAFRVVAANTEIIKPPLQEEVVKLGPSVPGNTA